MTELVDIVSASGTPKATRVAQAKNRPPYQPAFDFYKPLREHLVQLHQSGSSRDEVHSILDDLTDPKKVRNYPEAVNGYHQWWGRKSFRWFEPPFAIFEASGVEVRVNPEMGLEINGIPHLVKLYFKAPVLTKQRVDLITHLMSNALAGEAPEGCTMSVLDVRRSRLFSPTVPVPRLRAALIGELAYVAALWDEV